MNKDCKDCISNIYVNVIPANEQLISIPINYIIAIHTHLLTILSLNSYNFNTIYDIPPQTHPQTPPPLHPLHLHTLNGPLNLLTLLPIRNPRLLPTLPHKSSHQLLLLKIDLPKTNIIQISSMDNLVLLVKNISLYHPPHSHHHLLQ